MNNQLWGALTISLTSIGYFYSWKFQKCGRYTTALWLLILCGFILRIYTASDFFLHEWDERYHALVAKNLMHHWLVPTLYDDPVLSPDYRNWTISHVWLHKQPLPLWTMAASMRLFGVNEIALRLPSILFTTIGIGLTFFIAFFLFNKKTGYLSAFLYSINGLIIELAAGRVATDHVDIFFLFFIELAIFFSIVYIQKQRTLYTILAGISLGAAILSKWLPALVVLPVWALLVGGSKKITAKQMLTQFFILLTACILIFLPWQVYIFHYFPRDAGWENAHNFRHITETLDSQGGPFYYFFDKIRINYGELIYLPLAWFSWMYLKRRDNNSLAILVWFWLPFLFFSAIKTKMQAYILFTCPALFIMTAVFWQMLAARQDDRFKWLYNIILFLLVALPVRYSIERIKPFNRIDRDPQWAAGLRALGSQHIKNGVLLNYDKPIEAMFYTNLIAYQQLPSKAEITALVSKGYTVLINGEVPDDIKNMQGVQMVWLK